MKMVYINSAKPIAAQVNLDSCDDEAVLLPLTPQMQKAFHRRAVRNRPGKILNASLN